MEESEVRPNHMPQAFFDALVEIRRTIREPLSQYLQALAEIYEHDQENYVFAQLCHDVVDVLVNNFENAAANFAPGSSYWKYLTRNEMLNFLYNRFKAPIEAIEESAVSAEDKAALISVLNQALEKIESFKVQEADKDKGSGQHLS